MVEQNSTTSPVAQIFKDPKLAAFVRQLPDYCRSKKTFHKEVDINVSHIAFRAAETNKYIRHAVSTPEKIAAVILDGIVNEPRSVFGSAIQVAFEGKFANLRFVDWDKNEETTVAQACVRVVVKQSRPKHLVVTVYVDSTGDIDAAATPEVRNESPWI